MKALARFIPTTTVVPSLVDTYNITRHSRTINSLREKIVLIDLTRKFYRLHTDPEEPPLQTGFDFHRVNLVWQSHPIKKFLNHFHEKYPDTKLYILPVMFRHFVRGHFTYTNFCRSKAHSDALELHLIDYKMSKLALEIDNVFYVSNRELIQNYKDHESLLSFYRSVIKPDGIHYFAGFHRRLALVLKKHYGIF